MGSSVRAKCECGFQEDFLIGGGMATFKTHCLFPCLCRNCKTIVSSNLLQKPPICPDCESKSITPYDHSELCERKGTKVVAYWRLGTTRDKRVILTDGAYYCPSCDSYRLNFEDSGLCWD